MSFAQITWRGLLVLALGAALVACGSQQDGQPSKAPRIKVGTQLAQQQELRRQILDSPRTLDPSLATGVPAQHVMDDLFEGLVTLDEAARTVPGVAERWETSADGLTWTFHLRADARWSNGEPVTAADFVYAWRRIVDPKTVAEYGQALGPIVNAMDITIGKLPPEQLGAEARDSRTLVVHLVSPTPYFLDLLTNMYLAPLYAPSIEQWGDKWTQGGHMVSNGPFMLKSSVINGPIDLIKNPHYWDAAHVRVTRVTYLPVVDTVSAVSQFKAGGIDWLNRFPATDTERLTAELGNQVVHGPYFGTVMFGFDFTKPPFKGNTKLRRALSMAIDRKIIAKYLRHGIVPPAYQMIPPLEGYTPAIPDWAKLSDEDRHALARKLYHEAGYSDENPLKVQFSYPTGGADVRQYLEAIVAMWRMNLGAEVQLYNMQWKVLLQSLQYKQLNFFWHAWIGDFPDPFTFMQLFTKGFPQNYGEYDNPKFDDVVARAQATSDIPKRYALFAEAEKILNDDGAYIPVFFYPTEHLVKPYLKGWQDNVIDRNLSRYMYVLEHEGS